MCVCVCLLCTECPQEYTMPVHSIYKLKGHFSIHLGFGIVFERIRVFTSICCCRSVVVRRHSTNTEWRECNVLCLNLYIFKMIFTYIHIMCCWVNIILVDKIICVSAGKAIFYVRQSRRRWQWWLSIACSIWGGIGDRHIYILRISRQCCRLASNDCEYLWESNMTGRRNLQLCSFRHIYHIGHR